MTDVPPLPDGYEPHELQADCTGPLFIEGQMNAYARAAIEAELAVVRADHPPAGRRVRRSFRPRH